MTERVHNPLGYSEPVAGPDAESAGLAPGRRRWLLILVKAIVSASLMYWILRDTDFSQVWESFLRADAGILVGTYFLCFVGYLISASRWQILLKSQGVHADRAFLIKSFMVGLFFNNLLPSTVGGDVVRAHDSTRFGISRVAALAVIMVDRFLGLLALASIALVSVALSGGLHADIAIPYAIVIACLVFAAAVSAIFLGSRRDSLNVFAKVMDKLPAAVQRLAEKAVRAFAAFRGRTRDLWVVYALGLLLQVNVVLSFYLIGKALHLPIGFGTFFLVTPLALFIMLAPVSINGVGVREGAFVFLLGLSGVAKPDALAVAWISYGFLVLQGITGGLVYAFRR
jgi:uncharacterized protein (TIRG00374 family)